MCFETNEAIFELDVNNEDNNENIELIHQIVGAPFDIQFNAEILFNIWNSINDNEIMINFFIWLKNTPMDFTILEEFFHICIINNDIIAIELIDEYNIFENIPIDPHALLCALNFDNEDMIHFIFNNFEFIPFTLEQICELTQLVENEILHIIIEKISTPSINDAFFELICITKNFSLLFWIMEKGYTPTEDDYSSIKYTWDEMTSFIVKDYILSRDS